jgi:hypothetical protein
MIRMFRTASLAALALLAGCAGTAKQARLCPEVGVLSDAGRLEVYNGPENPDGLAYRAGMRVSGGSCSFQRDKVVVDFDLDLVAYRGPAMEGDRADLGYFVAVVDGRQNILARREFGAPLDFQPGAVRSGTRDSLTETIPLPRGAVAGDYSIAAGFVLTEDQVYRNRRDRLLR